jgi:hypothetical protein
MKKLYVILGMVALIGFCFTPVMADEAIMDESAGENLQVKWIGAVEFESFWNNPLIVLFQNREIFSFWGPGAPPVANPDVSAIIHLPSGASLERVDLMAFDNTGVDGQNVTLDLRRENWNNGNPNTANILTLRTDILDDGGGYELVQGSPTDIPDRKTIRNSEGYYHAMVTLGNGNQANLLRLFGIRLVYQLQIAEADPDNPTFGDVDANDWYYDAVEALAASGITEGCGGGDFCPDLPVTRGQMAQFLARALGLYWDAADGF